MAFEDKTRALLAGGQAPAGELLREMVSTVVQDTIRAEFERFLGAAPYERTAPRRGHRNGSYKRTLKTRVGALVLDVPRDRAGMFRKTTGLVDVVREALQPLAGKIHLAFVFGSVAQGKERQVSDVDVLILRDPLSSPKITAVPLFEPPGGRHKALIARWTTSFRVTILAGAECKFLLRHALRGWGDARRSTAETARHGGLSARSRNGVQCLTPMYGCGDSWRRPISLRP